MQKKAIGFKYLMLCTPSTLLKPITRDNEYQ